MDTAQDIVNDIEVILDRIAKLDHPHADKALLMIQEGSDWLREKVVE